MNFGGELHLQNLQTWRLCAMVVAGAVNSLVGDVLAGLEAGVRSRCDRGRIVLALVELCCATTMDDLREMMLADANMQLPISGADVCWGDSVTPGYP